MKTVNEMTIKQLEREGTKIIRGFRKQLKGGLQYGMDYPTLWALFPDEMTRLKELKTEWSKRNGR